MTQNHNETFRYLGVAAAVIGMCFVLAIPDSARAEEKVPLLDEAAEKLIETVDKDFDDSLKDLGELAGEVFACEGDEPKRDKHEARVSEIYSELNKLFGSNRAFIFSVAFGYGAANEQDEKTCTELTDEFEDRYGAISKKYDLID